MASSCLSEVESGLGEPVPKLLTRLAALYKTDPRDLVECAGWHDAEAPAPHVDEGAEVAGPTSTSWPIRASDLGYGRVVQYPWMRNDSSSRCMSDSAEEASR